MAGGNWWRSSDRRDGRSPASPTAAASWRTSSSAPTVSAAGSAPSSPPRRCLRYAGYVAWRGLVPEAELPAAFRAAGFGDYCFCFPPGGQFIGYPVAGGHWSSPAGAATISSGTATYPTGRRSPTC